MIKWDAPDGMLPAPITRGERKRKAREMANSLHRVQVEYDKAWRAGEAEFRGHKIKRPMWAHASSKVAG